VTGMFYKGKERRLHKRHDVYWDALLEVKFPDFQGQIPVKVINFSIKGAVLHSKQFSAGDRHLILSDEKPELKLIISLPEIDLKSRIKIIWYKLLHEESVFQVGTEFIDFMEKNRISVDKLMKIIKGNQEI